MDVSSNDVLVTAVVERGGHGWIQFDSLCKIIQSIVHRAHSQEATAPMVEGLSESPFEFDGGS